MRLVRERTERVWSGKWTVNVRCETHIGYDKAASQVRENLRGGFCIFGTPPQIRFRKHSCRK